MAWLATAKPLFHVNVHEHDPNHRPLLSVHQHISVLYLPQRRTVIFGFATATKIIFIAK